MLQRAVTALDERKEDLGSLKIYIYIFSGGAQRIIEAR